MSTAFRLFLQQYFSLSLWHLDVGFLAIADLSALRGSQYTVEFGSWWKGCFSLDLFATKAQGSRHHLVVLPKCEVVLVSLWHKAGWGQPSKSPLSFVSSWLTMWANRKMRKCQAMDLLCARSFNAHKNDGHQPGLGLLHFLNMFHWHFHVLGHYHGLEWGLRFHLHLCHQDERHFGGIGQENWAWVLLAKK